MFLSGFSCVPLVFPVRMSQENATSEALQPSQEDFSEASSPKKSVRPTRSMSQFEAPGEQSSGVEGGGEY